MDSNQNKRDFDRYIKDRKKENPFYSSYVFKKEDLDRAAIKKWRYPILWILPTYVQSAEGYVVHFKMWGGRYYLMRMEKL